MSRVHVYHIGTIVTVAPVRLLRLWELRSSHLTDRQAEVRYLLDPDNHNKLFYSQGAPMLLAEDLSWTGENGMNRYARLMMPDGKIGLAEVHRLRFLHGPGRR